MKCLVRSLSAVVVLAVASTTFAQELNPVLLKDFEWRWIGPAATGGRIIDLAVPEGRPFEIYVASASGGLFHTANNGTTWESLFENEGTISIGDIALDPGNDDVIWVGTGEANNQRSSYWGDGVYKSTDAGQTWDNMGLRDSHHIGRIVVDPDDSNTVYVAALGHLYTPNAQRGLFKTTDGGKTWKAVLTIDADVGVVDVVLDPFDSSTIYAASYERRRRAWNFDGAGPGSAIHRSRDGGATWTRLEGGLPDGEIGRIGLDVSLQNQGVIYACVSNQNDKPPETVEPPRLGVRVEEVEGGTRVLSVTEDSAAEKAEVKEGDVITGLAGVTVTDLSSLREAVAAARDNDDAVLVLSRDSEKVEKKVTLKAPEPRSEGQIGGEIYRSEDGGDTWEKRNEDPVGGTPAYYYGQIRVDPTDDQKIYVMSVPLHMSEDGGKTWHQGNLASNCHVDHHALWINPDDPDHLVLGNDGGLYLSYDAGQNWDHNNNLPLSQFYAIGIDHRVPYHVYGGTQDNGTWMGPSRTRSPRGASNEHWTNIGGGDGFYVQVDPEDADVVYYESQFGGIGRLDLRTWRRQGIRPPRTNPDGPRDRFNWNSPILISHHNPRTIYFGGNRLFKSYDRGDQWHVISPDLTTQDPDKLEGNVPHCTITSVAESPIDPHRLLAGTDDGNVQWSDDGGATWTNVAGLFPEMPLRLWVSRVELSRHDVDTAYVSFTGYREDNFAPYVYMTRDAGETWESIAGNLPSGCINVVKEDPRNEDVLYVGTEFGAFVTIDRGTHWVRLDQGLPTIPVHDLAIHERQRELIIGTHGRGMYVLDVAPLQEMSKKLLAGGPYLFSHAPVIAWRSLFHQAEGFTGQRPYRAGNPSHGANLTYYLPEDLEEGAVSLEVKDRAGDVVKSFEAPFKAGLHRLRWDLRRDAQETEGERPRRRRSAVSPDEYTVVFRVGEDEFTRRLLLREDPLDAVRAEPVPTRPYHP